MIKKILIRKEKREYIEDLKRYVVVSEGKKYFIENIDQNFHCAEGIILKSELAKENVVIKSNQDKEFFIFNATFMDSYKGIKKLAQTIPLKDLGFIMAETGINSDSVVVDTGSGSGGSACFLARHVKKVYTYDVNELHLVQVRKNIEYFGLTNVVAECNDSYENIPVTDADLILLDLPEPWRAINSANNALKIGGLIVAYCPQVTQAQTFINELMKKENYIQVKSVEMVERDWKIEGQIVKPRSLSNIHSGFITIVRKIN